MAYGTGLSAAASRALVRGAARPSKAERMQAESISAQANAASLQRQFASQQDDRNYQRQTDQRNVERNDRANEIRQKEEYAERMMERQNEMAVEAQRKQDAFKLQTVMSKRTTNAQPGGTQQPIAGPRPAFARLTSGQGSIDYSTEGGLTQTAAGIGGITRQLREPKPELKPEPLSILDQKRVSDMQLSRSKRVTDLKERQSEITRTDFTREGELSQVQSSQAHQVAFQEYGAINDELRRLAQEGTLMGDNGSEAASTAVNHVTTFGGVADAHRDAAEDDADHMNVPENEREAHVRNYLRVHFGYNLR